MNQTNTTCLSSILPHELNLISGMIYMREWDDDSIPLHREDLHSDSEVDFSCFKSVCFENVFRIDRMYFESIDAH
jgi:hypothetical protein